MKFLSFKNEGAFLNGESIKVSDRKKLKDALFVATFSPKKLVEKISTKYLVKLMIYHADV